MDHNAPPTPIPQAIKQTQIQQKTTANLTFFVRYVLKGADTTNVKLADAGLLLSDTLRAFMYDTGVDNGLAALGYKSEDIPELVKGTLPQHRVTKLAPAGAPGEEELARLFEDSLTLY